MRSRQVSAVCNGHLLRDDSGRALSAPPAALPNQLEAPAAACAVVHRAHDFARPAAYGAPGHAVSLPHSAAGLQCCMYLLSLERASSEIADCLGRTANPKYMHRQSSLWLPHCSPTYTFRAGGSWSCRTSTGGDPAARPPTGGGCDHSHACPPPAARTLLAQRLCERPRSTRSSALLCGAGLCTAPGWCHHSMCAEGH